MTRILNVRGMKPADLPADAVYIGRASGGWSQSKWHNPYRIGPDGDRDEVIAKFRDHLLGRPDLLADLPELADQDLYCWCAPERCHGEVLATLGALTTLHAAGHHLIPMSETTKKPLVKWRHGGTDYVEIKPTMAQVTSWYATFGTTSWATLCGTPISNLVVIDVEAAGMASPIIATAVEMIPETCTRWTPGGGIHAHLRVTDGAAPAGVKLAYSADRVLLAETRGRGQYAGILGAGRSPGALPWAPHPVTTQELTTILGGVAAADELPDPPPRRERTAGGAAVDDTGEVLFAAVAEGTMPVTSFLDGWTVVGVDHRGRELLRRPDYGQAPTSDVSANVLDGVTVIHSAAVPWAETGVGYSPSELMTLSRFGGDYAKAMRWVERLARRSMAAGRSLNDEWPFEVLQRVAEVKDRQEDDEEINTRTKAGIQAAERFRLEVRDIVAEERAAAGIRWSPPETLEKVVHNPTEVAGPRIAKLMVKGGRTTLVAARKAGKTTLVGNLLRAALTGERFLGIPPGRKFAGTLGWEVAEKLTGAALVLSFEMNRDQFGMWLADVGLADEFGDRVLVWNLRGMGNPLASETGRAELGRYLDEFGVELVVIDTFGRGFTGRSQDSAGDVTAFLGRLDELVGPDRDLVVTVHAGWTGERSRGSSALEDWPDTIMTLSKADPSGDHDGPAVRFLSVAGRDVPERDGVALAYDGSSRRVWEDPGGPSRKEHDAKTSASKKAATDARRAADDKKRDERITADILAALGKAGEPLSGNAVVALVTGSKEAVKRVLERLVQIGQVVRGPGPHNSSVHWLATAGGCGS